jgi:O-acetyl-ADP-ribose deacetylase (regulator of RNase III)
MRGCVSCKEWHEELNIKTEYGDLIQKGLNGDFDVIIHGCNCFNNMGAGIAKDIKYWIPYAYKVDCQTIKGDKKKLGTFTDTREDPNNDLIVVNAYTQYQFNAKRYGVCVDYNAIKKVFEAIKKEFGNKSLRFGIPLIGAGLAGGRWEIISKDISEAMAGEDITLVYFRR